jgi:hypothetical protein
MKFLKTVLLLLLVNTLLASCTFQVRPVPMNTQVGYIGVAESRKMPLKVAVVVPDPPTYRFMYTPPNERKTIDQTGQMGEQLWPVNSELGKASKEVFAQVFEQATLLRQPPAPGSEYDLIITVKLREIDMVGSMGVAGLLGAMNMTMNLYYVWNITILNDEGVEIFKREDKTSAKSFRVSTSMEEYTASWGRASSDLMAEMVKSWGLMIYDSREINEYLKEQEDK